MSAAPPELAALHERASILADLERVHALLFWDQNVMMPPSGAAARGDHSATLESVTHERLTDPELGRLLERLEPWAAGEDPDDDGVRLVRELRRDFEKAVRVPTSLAAEASRAAALGQAAWQEARAAADFGRFRDALALQIELRHRYVACFEGFEHPYDVLLDDFEPSMTTARLRPLLGELVDGLVPLVTEAASDEPPPAGHPFGGPYTVEDQRRAVMDILEGVGFDPDSWRLDVAPHPFAQRIAPGDVRITTRYDLHDFSGAYFGALHEFGHGLYEAGIPARLGRSPLGSPVSLGVHESQSRMWENLVGREPPVLRLGAAAARGAAARRARRHDRGRPLPRRQRRPPQPDPRRGRRDDVQPAHRPALRARARPDRGLARGRRPAARVERGHAPAAGARRARRRPGRPAGRALGRRAARLLPHLHARQPDGRAAVGDAARRAARASMPSSSAATSRRCAPGSSTACTPTAASSSPPSSWTG